MFFMKYEKKIEKEKKRKKKLSTFNRGENEMGYALFTARKLALTARVNQLNAQLMSISQQQMDLANQISNKQQANNMRTASANMAALNIFQNTMGGVDSSSSDYQKTFDTAQMTYNKAMAQNTVDSTMSDAEIQQLSQQDNALDMQRETLETQLNAAQQELEQVKKTEESAIKNATPKYVG